MNKARYRRHMAARARYRNRIDGAKIGRFMFRWIMDGYRFDDTWYYVRMQK